MAETALIKAFANGGEAVGTLENGKTVFLRGAIPGERVSLEIVQDKKRFARAKLLEVLEKSCDRITPECPNFGSCPGCSYLHVPYSVEISWKQRQLEWLTGKLEVEEFGAPNPSPERFNWRNKIVLHCENGVCGYRAEDNVSIVQVKECPIALPEINELVPGCDRGGDRDIVLRKSGCDPVKIFSRNSSCGVLTEEIPGFGKFQVDSNGFFQTNIRVASMLIGKVTALLAEQNCSELCELYCGVGVFSICAAGKIPGLRAHACEISAPAVKLAKSNAALHGVGGACTFQHADAGKFFSGHKNKSKDYTLLVDPPRTGMDKTMLSAIRKHAPEKMIYISCAADTLARDLEALKDIYRVRYISLYDMFPGTAHFETLTVLEK